ncbi:hypothetical protein DIPPA_00836 [Diplonema papillatum]|nr:hypothetical protein DIPPA_00836 [Diplonema papillatum]
MARVVAVFLSYLASVDAFYTLLKHAEPKCFIEEVGPVMDTVTVHYNTTNPIRFEVKTARGGVITDIMRNDRSGAFQFITVENVEGAYEVCATAHDETYGRNPGINPGFTKLRLRIDKADKHRIIELQKGNNPLSSAVKLANEMGFSADLGLDSTALKKHSYYLSDLVIELYDMRTEAAAMVIRQRRHQKLAENTFNRVVMMALITAAVSGFIFYVNFAYMKHFLREKKLV